MDTQIAAQHPARMLRNDRCICFYRFTDAIDKRDNVSNGIIWQFVNGDSNGDKFSIYQF